MLSNVRYFISRRKYCHISQLRYFDQKDATGEVENMSPQQHINVTKERSKNICLLTKKRLWEKVIRKGQIVLGYVAH